MNKTKSLIYCGLFTALIAIGAFIKIPVPVVPFTLQFLFTMLAGLLLGSKRGMASVVAYMVLGLIGLPIFSEGGGFWYILKPSLGYIIGFAIGTFVTGLMAERDCLCGGYGLLLYHLQLCHQHTDCCRIAVFVLLRSGGSG